MENHTEPPPAIVDMMMKATETETRLKNNKAVLFALLTLILLLCAPAIVYGAYSLAVSSGT